MTVPPFFSAVRGLRAYIGPAVRIRRALRRMNLSPLLLAAALQAPAGLSERLDGLLARFEPFGFSGAVLVEQGGRVVLERGYGLADRAAGVPARAETVFDIGSLAKQFTAAAVLLLEQEGKLELEQPFARYLPGVPEDKRAITLHQLLSHTSGLARNTSLPWFEPADWEEVLASIYATPLAFAPGSAWAYSNLGFSVLAAVVERASGRPFERFLEERLFEPASMRSTGVYGRLAPGMAAALSYQDGVPGSAPRDWPFSRVQLGAGGLWSTVGDLQRWMTALRADRVLAPAQRERMWTVVRDGYGYGWVVSKTGRGSRVIMHAGDFMGYNADLRWYPDEDYLIVFLSNVRVLGRGLRDVVVNRLSLALQGESAPLPPAVLSADPELLHRCTGRYRLPGGDAFVAAAEDGGLRLWGEGRAALHELIGEAAGAPHAALAEKLRAAVDGTAREDLDLFRAILSEAYPWEGVRLGIAHGWSVARAQHGPYRRTEVLGTVPQGDGVEVFLRVHFERGAEDRSFLLQGGKIAGMREDPGRPGEARYLPVNEREFVHFDLFTGVERRIRFSLPPQGPASALTLLRSGGWTSARRAPSS